MQKAKIKIKKIKQNKSQREAMENIVNTLLSGSSASLNPYEIYSKYINYRDNIKSFINTNMKLSELIKDYEPNLAEFNTALMKEYKLYFLGDYSRAVNDQNIFNELCNNYDEFKKSPLIHWVTNIASNIKKSGITGKIYNDVKKMSQQGLAQLNIYTKIIDEINVTYDLSNIFHENVTLNSKTKQQVLQLLGNLYTFGKAIYNLMRSPDLPLDELFDMLLDQLKDIKKKVRGADKLFLLLESKSALFKKNFNKYYKETMITNSPFSLFSSFLKDVVVDEKIQDPILITQSRVFLKELRTLIDSTSITRQKDKTVKKNIDSLMDIIVNYIDKFDNLDNEYYDEQKLQDLCEEFSGQFMNSETELQ